LYLVGGSILEIGDDAARPYNTCVAFDPTGAIIGRYRKIHLFDVDIPNQVTVRESDTRVGGSDTVVVPTELGQLGLALCYDLRFPELFRRLVLAGAEILCLPAAFTFPTGAAHWEVLVRARAIENLCYVVAANQFGRSPSGIEDYGSSLVVDPWGVALARAGWEETVIVGEVDLARLRRLRRELPCLEHARLL
jgi:predicted amidohydrolase